MNAVLLLKEREQRPITVDLAVADLYTGVCEFVKAGGVTTFIKKGRHIDTIRAAALPAGVFKEAAPESVEISLSDGDKIIMVTDGVLDALRGGGRGRDHEGDPGMHIRGKSSGYGR